MENFREDLNHHHLILTHQTKQQYQNRLYIDTMCEWIKRPRSGTNNNPIVSQSWEGLTVDVKIIEESLHI